ncbi:hypothetical protein, unlikely [Trypanosoma congolense IL3000]|uniref:Uncharacterized protein n=1 Tax=Trypanosoma congolense (strain IL3000) TaxID=1068625 RepID=F9WG74_TRYCI|nr:hypothetical protein, unlikely [Trypanosoma congolense IL3000]
MAAFSGSTDLPTPPRTSRTRHATRRTWKASFVSRSSSSTMRSSPTRRPSTPRTFNTPPMTSLRPTPPAKVTKETPAISPTPLRRRSSKRTLTLRGKENRRGVGYFPLFIPS